MKKILKHLLIYILITEARLMLKKHKPFVIAVTGNVGKTSTKDTIFFLLDELGLSARKSEKSFNTEIGIPLTILGLPNQWSSVYGWISNIIMGLLKVFLEKHFPKYLVLEVGADRPGDIQKISSWLNVDVVVLTAIPDLPVHIENFKNIQELVKEKKSILNASSNIKLIYDTDSDLSKSIGKEFVGEKVSFGFSKEADCYAEDFNFICDENDIYMKCMVNGNEMILRNNLGKQQIYPNLAAIALADVLDLNIKNYDMFEKKQATPGRMRILPGKEAVMLIDDTYNASPYATDRAIQAMNDISCIRGKKIVVLGDMLELGVYAARAHSEILKKAVKSVDKVFAFGAHMSEAARQIESSKLKSYKLQDKDKLISDLKNEIDKNDLVLFKGSQGVRMETVLIHFLNEEIDPQDTLVRQEKMWHEK